MPRLILASRSPFRRQLLLDAGYEVEAIPAEIIEPDPARFVDLHAGLIHIAQLKARAVAERGAAGLIFAADTVGRVAPAPRVASRKSQAFRVFGKATDRTDAQRMLQAISGTTHSVLTGWCLLRSSDRLHLSGVEETVIEMRRWSDAELESYLDSGAWIDKSGAYGLQFPVDPFVTRLEGSASNVVGVPLERLRALFAEFPPLLKSEFPPHTPS
jgi:septum formation protein